MSVHSRCTLHGVPCQIPDILQSLRWTKLNPPRIAADVVRRARIRERLERSLDRPLTLVCAPAGYGKTTLLSDWLAGSGYPYIWLSLDESDSDLAVFLNYFVAAIRTAYPQACTDTLGLWLRRIAAVTRLANALANDLEALPSSPVRLIDAVASWCWTTITWFTTRPSPRCWARFGAIRRVPCI